MSKSGLDKERWNTKCNICGEFFTEKGLRSHVTRTHPDETSEQAYHRGFYEGTLLLQAYKDQLVREIEEYFDGLIVIPFPQKTKDSLISIIRESKGE